MNQRQSAVGIQFICRHIVAAQVYLRIFVTLRAYQRALRLRTHELCQCFSPTATVVGKMITVEQFDLRINGIPSHLHLFFAFAKAIIE